MQLTGRESTDAPDGALSLVARALAPLAAVGDRQQITARVCQLLASTVATGCQIDLIEAGGMRTAMRTSAGATTPAGALDAETLAGVARSGTPRVLDAPLGGCWMIVPIVLSARPLGTLSVLFDDARVGDNEATLAALYEIAASVAVALADADVHESAVHVSHSLQATLLPAALPTQDWFELAALYAPGTTGLEVGGDWYDAQVLDDGTLALSVGDVAGHSIEAAARMGELRSAMVALRLVSRAPGDVIGVLHRLTATANYLASATCARIDPSGSLQWASAGHLPPLVLHATGGVEVLDTEQSPLLGVAYRGSVPTSHHRLVPGDTVVLYTDGIVERRDEVLGVGISRLARRLDELGSLAPSVLVQRLIELREAPTSTHDDVAVLAATWLPQGAASAQRAP